MQVNTSYRDILNMAYPVMVGSIATTVLNVTDSAFLGRVGEVELGASAIGGVLYFVFVMIGISVGIGTQILIARRAGERKHEEIGAIVDQSMLLMMVLSALIFILLKFIIPDILSGLIKDHQVASAVGRFLNYRSYGIFFVMTATVFRSFFVGIAQPKIFAAYSFFMAAVNIYLCDLLIFGRNGFFAMGIAGAGLASSLSEFVALIFLVVYTLSKSNIHEFRLFRFKSLSHELNKKIIGLSAPLVIQNILSMLGWFLFFLFIEKSGKHALAISNAVRGVYMIAMTPVWGYSVAANSMISNLIGQNRSDEVLLLLNRILKMALATTLVFSVISFIFRRELLSIFTDNSALINDSMSSLNVVLISMFVFSVAIVMVSAVSGTGATRMALYIEVLAILIYLIYIYYTTFVSNSAVEIVWMSEFVYWVITFGLSFIYVRSLRWKKIEV
jgi:MATE family multidrug resistance protein